MVFQPEFKGKRKLMSQIQDSKTERNSYFLLLFSCPVVSDSLWPHTAGPQAFLSLAISRSLRWEDQVHVQCVCDAIQPSHPLTPFSPSALNLSQAEGLFQWASVRIRWPKYWSLSFSISPSSEYSGCISHKIDWFYLPAVQGTFKYLGTPWPCQVNHHRSVDGSTQ